jgi:hypothetical protein
MEDTMNFSLASLSVLTFSLLSASLASATTYSVALNASESKSYVSASATVDYGSRTIEISLQPRMPVCPEGRMCIQAFPPAITTTYKKVKSTQNKCGVITTRAIVDKRPVDGLKTEVILVNNSQNICDNNPEVTASLNVKTSWYNRLQGREEQTLDAFVAAKDLTAILETVSSSRYISGELVFNRGTGDVNLTLQAVMPPCAEGFMCAQVMPEPVSYFFTQATSVTTDCGVVQTTTPVISISEEGDYMTLLINDNRRNRCPTFAPLAPLDIVVRTSKDPAFRDGSAVNADLLDTLQVL